MNAARFFRNPHFREYIRLLGKLHELIRADADESDEGEGIRDQMDGPAELLTREEIESANGISADLYSLSDTGPHTVQPMTDDAQKGINGALQARNAGDFAKSLDLLRKNQAYVDFATLTYVRGSVMLEAGEFALAADFFRCAKDLAPNNTNYTYMWLDALSRSGSDNASKEAEEILAKAGDFGPKLVLKAADIEFCSTKQMTENQAKPIIQKLVPVFEDTIVRLQTSGEAQDSPSLLASAFALLGFCYEHLGAFDEARQYFDQGLKLFPNNDALLTARGIQRYASDNSGAVEDFSDAVQLRSPLVWPYFFMAHHNLVRDRFEDCLRFANLALRLAGTNAVRADCLEWIAICQSMLGHPAETVRAAFHAAEQLAPTNQRIQANHKRFEDSRSSEAPVNWEQMDLETVQRFGLQEFQIAA